MADSGSLDLLGASPVERSDLEAYNAFLEALLSETNGFTCGESHKGFSWPNQESPSSNGEVINRNLQNQLFDYGPGLTASSTQGGITSSSARKQGIHQRNTGKTLASSERKKEIDKRYRDRCRDDKKRMESELTDLGQENVHLHDENKNLVMEKEFINKSLLSTEIETKQLNIEIHNLQSDMARQQIFVDSFLKKLDVSNNNHDINHKLKIKKLQNEIMVLRQNNWDDWTMNKPKLVQEIENLEHENKLLKVQVDALCEKINNDNDHGDAKALGW